MASNEEYLDQLLESEIIIHWHGGQGRGHFEVFDSFGISIDTFSGLSSAQAKKALLKHMNDETFEMLCEIAGLTKEEKDPIELCRKWCPDEFMFY